MGGALVRGSPRDIKWGERVQKPLIFMHFHAVSLGKQHEIWSKQHNGKVSIHPFSLARMKFGISHVRRNRDSDDNLFWGSNS